MGRELATDDARDAGCGPRAKCVVVDGVPVLPVHRDALRVLAGEFTRVVVSKQDIAEMKSLIFSPLHF